MSKSQRIRVADLREIYLLVGECCELGTDPKLWRIHFLSGMKRLLDADFGSWAMGGIEPNGAPIALQELINVGLEWSATKKIQNRINDAPMEHPAVRMVFPLKQQFVSFRRPERIPDRQWYNSAYFKEVHSAADCDDFIGCYARVNSDQVEGISVLRSRDKKLFAPRHGELFRLAAVEIARLMKSRLASLHQPSVLHLPKRQREVLLYLLEGENEKQIANRLGITQSTVHEYVKKLHRYYGVANRGELMSKFVSGAGIRSLQTNLSGEDGL